MKTTLLVFLGIILSSNLLSQYTVPAGPPVVHTASVNWAGDIIIEPGATLIVDGATFGMATGAKIIIEDTGLLIGQNGAVFNSSTHGGSWYGIVIEGTTLGNTTANLAIDFDETTVADAQLAINTFGGTGGDRERSIRCENTTFINNGQHLFLTYPLSNLTATGFTVDFINCDFLGATGSRAVQLKCTRFHNYVNCTFDCGAALPEVFHIDATNDCKWNGNLFKPNKNKHMFFHYASKSNQIFNNIFEIDATGSQTAGGYDFISIMASENNDEAVTRTLIQNNVFTSMDGPLDNSACGIYSEALSLAKIDIIGNEFTNLASGIDINDTWSVVLRSSIRENSFTSYLNGIITRGDNRKLRIHCNTFETYENDATAIWNETGTLRNYIGSGPLNEFFTSDIHLASTGAAWTCDYSTSNANPPTNISGSVVSSSVTPSVQCILARNQESEGENTTGIQNNQTFTVYPNPSVGLFSVDLTAIDADLVQLNVVDVTGRVIYNLPIQGADNRRLDLDLSNQAPGIYFIHISSETYNATKQITIK